MAFFLSVLVGIPLGIFAALGHNRWPDYLSTGISVIGIAMPSFVLAILLIVFFGVTLKWFPTSGWKGPDTWVLPTIALAGFPIAVIARYTRASMLEVTRKDYIRTAHSKGVGDRAVVSRHMIRNALIPVVTILGPTLAFLVTGSFIIESIFGIPGIGRYYITSIGQHDYGVLMAMTILYAFVVAFLNLVVDVAVRIHRPAHPLQLGARRWRQRPCAERRAAEACDGGCGVTPSGGFARTASRWSG